MATSRGQRIGIWVIAGALTFGTLAGFVAMVLQPRNEAADTQRVNDVYSAYQKSYEEYQAKIQAIQENYTAKTDEYSAKYYSSFSGYQSRVGAFKAADVTELKKEDLKVGTGEDLSTDDGILVYYIGWNPSGKIFDGSIDGKKLKAPFIVQPGGVIQGWTQGLQGMKAGGVRELTIPADLAYGEQGSGEDIPANTPLKFIVFAVEKVNLPKQPEVPQELLTQ